MRISWSCNIKVGAQLGLHVAAVCTRGIHGNRNSKHNDANRVKLHDPVRQM